MLETSLGEMVFDLHTELCPKVAHVALEPLSRPILPLRSSRPIFWHFLHVSAPAHESKLGRATWISLEAVELLITHTYIC
jgi:hypothetical protein